MQFVPAPEAPSTSSLDTPAAPVPQEQRHPVAHMHVRNNRMDDFVHRGDLEKLLDYVYVPKTTPHVPPLSHTICAQTATKTEADVIQYEVWHQRLAHCSETKLRKTQKHVDGIPTFQTPALPDLLRCRACDIASLKKAPRGPATIATTILHPGQIFHMDLGFFRGPGNLVEVYERTAAPTPKIIESRQGFVCYLLAIDRHTRYVWVFPPSFQVGST